MALLIFAVVLLLVLSVVGSRVTGSDPRPFPPALPFVPRIAHGTDTGEPAVTAPTETAATNPDPADTGAGLGEAQLAARLMTGQLSAADYQQAMAQLAAADAVSRPIVVPPERGP